MIQFNLLPDVKVEYIKTRRTKRLVTLVSIGLSLLSIFVLLLSFVSVDVVQKKSLHDLDRDITSNNNTLKSLPSFDKILTVQNQLNTLTSLHDQKPVSSRLYCYLSQLTPTGISLNSLKSDFTANTLELTGTAPSLDLVNQFVDTIKATTYTATTADPTKAPDTTCQPGTQTGSKKAFSNVVLSSFGKGTTGATYTIDLGFDPPIFANTNTVVLTVPNSTVSSSNALFKGAGN